ncbi:hypothetical protein INT43_001377 [Umbelopsis isabellina]|uniref:Uncharacterized protein n=1 Tax=Mortierella isabellina TaxID=91625 RepID=A0A8H7UAI2_MORIS|nr:hypothetical protein INT43_001377 [Umbelopsis isabellina]
MLTHMFTFLAVVAFAIMTMVSANGTKHQVTVTNSGFSPSSICIFPGDSITWYFQDAGHNVEETTDIGSCTSKHTFKSTTMQGGWRWSRQFKTLGLTTYMSSNNNDCANGFKGDIHVQDRCDPTSSSGNSSSESSSDSGSSSASPAPSSSPSPWMRDENTSTSSTPSSQTSPSSSSANVTPSATSSSSTRTQASWIGSVVVVTCIFLVL